MLIEKEDWTHGGNNALGKLSFSFFFSLLPFLQHPPHSRYPIIRSTIRSLLSFIAALSSVSSSSTTPPSTNYISDPRSLDPVPGYRYIYNSQFRHELILFYGLFQLSLWQRCNNARLALRGTLEPSEDKWASFECRHVTASGTHFQCTNCGVKCKFTGMKNTWRQPGMN